MTKTVLVLTAALLAIVGGAHAADYLEKTDFQKSRAFSPAVVTDGGRSGWLGGQTATTRAASKADTLAEVARPARERSRRRPRRTPGEAHGEGGAPPVTLAVGTNGPPVHLHEVPDEREADSESRLRSRQRGIPLAKTVEDIWKQHGGDASSGVHDAKLHLGFRALEPHIDPAIRRRELDGVGEQVPDDLLEALGISEDAGGG